MGIARNRPQAMLSLARMVTFSAKQNGHNKRVIWAGQSKADRPETPHIAGRGSLAERRGDDFSYNRFCPVELAGREPSRRNRKRSSRLLWALSLGDIPCTHRTTGRNRWAWSPSQHDRTRDKSPCFQKLLLDQPSSHIRIIK